MSSDIVNAIESLINYDEKCVEWDRILSDKSSQLLRANEKCKTLEVEKEKDKLQLIELQKQLETSCSDTHRVSSEYDKQVKANEELLYQLALLKEQIEVNGSHLNSFANEHSETQEQKSNVEFSAANLVDQLHAQQLQFKSIFADHEELVIQNQDLHHKLLEYSKDEERFCQLKSEFSGQLSHIKHKLQIANKESEFLLTQLHQVQEELEYYYDLSKKQSQMLHRSEIINKQMISLISILKSKSVISHSNASNL